MSKDEASAEYLFEMIKYPVVVMCGSYVSAEICHTSSTDSISLLCAPLAC